MRISRRALAVAALLALSALSVATVEESFIHTDDGCAIEIHCNACLLAMGSAGVIGTTFTLPPRIETPEVLTTPVAGARNEIPPPAAPSRGPPLT